MVPDEQRNRRRGPLLAAGLCADLLAFGSALGRSTQAVRDAVTALAPGFGACYTRVAPGAFHLRLVAAVACRADLMGGRCLRLHLWEV